MVHRTQRFPISDMLYTCLLISDTMISYELGDSVQFHSYTGFTSFIHGHKFWAMKILLACVDKALLPLHSYHCINIPTKIYRFLPSVLPNLLHHLIFALSVSCLIRHRLHYRFSYQPWPLSDRFLSHICVTCKSDLFSLFRCPSHSLIPVE